MPRKVIDCLVNVHFGEADSQPNWMLKVRDDYFKGPKSMFDPVDLSELLDEMDEHGRAEGDPDGLPSPHPRSPRANSSKPTRNGSPWRWAVGTLLRPMRIVRELAAVTHDLPVALRRCRPELLGRRRYPPSDAVYYPLYTKCAELDLPLCINTGIPGPPIPGEVQNPIHLDRVCVRFPELKLCMIHGADPWWDVAIRMLIKYPNLRLMTSAWSPKRLPESLLHYMRTRGQNKVIFASDWPVLTQRRVVPEATALDLPADVLDNYLYNNAEEFFFGDRQPLATPTTTRSRDGSLRTAQARTTACPKTTWICRTRTDSSSRPTARSRPCAPHEAIGLRQEPVGAAVRDGRDDDGAAGRRRRRRCDAGRSDPGRRGDRAGRWRRCRGSTTSVLHGCSRGWASMDSAVIAQRQAASSDSIRSSVHRPGRG